MRPINPEQCRRLDRHWRVPKGDGGPFPGCFPANSFASYVMAYPVFVAACPTSGGPKPPSQFLWGLQHRERGRRSITWASGRFSVQNPAKKRHFFWWKHTVACRAWCVRVLLGMTSFRERCTPLGAANAGGRAADGYGTAGRKWQAVCRYSACVPGSYFLSFQAAEPSSTQQSQRDSGEVVPAQDQQQEGLAATEICVGKRHGLDEGYRKRSRPYVHTTCAVGHTPGNTPGRKSSTRRLRPPCRCVRPRGRPAHTTRADWTPCASMPSAQGHSGLRCDTADLWTKDGKEGARGWGPRAEHRPWSA